MIVDDIDTAIVLDGIANPIPEKVFVPDSIAVFIPIISPRISSNGPPELPGLIGAAVWIAFGIENAMPTEVGSDRPIQLIMPVVIVSLRPKGLPIAITVSPTSILEEFPIASGLREENSYCLVFSMG
jgi:hypothetical protein